MPRIIEFPLIVKAAVAQFGGVFANAPERVHLGEYLTGLLVAEKKTVCGMVREFVQTTDQSCLNRWLGEVAWDETQLNRELLAWLQQEASTRYSAQGVITIDNVLVDHECQLRKGRGQTRHLYLVFLAHSLLMWQLRQGRGSEWARERLMTIGQACRAVAQHTLSQTIAWVVERVQQDAWSCQRIKAHLALP